LKSPAVTPRATIGGDAEPPQPAKSATAPIVSAQRVKFPMSDASPKLKQG
jgi:hypothetical protein